MPKKSVKVSAATAASILGTPIQTEQTKCVVCSKNIPAARLKALKSMDVTKDRFTCVNCSTTTKIKGLYLGEVGTSELQLCKKVYNDSVRSVFRRAEVEESEEEK